MATNKTGECEMKRKTIKAELEEKGIDYSNYYALRREPDGITGMRRDQPGRYNPRTNTGGRVLICTT